jgi:hypothetical protein
VSLSKLPEARSRSRLSCKLRYTYLPAASPTYTVSGQRFSMVRRSIKFTQSQLPANIYGIDEIACGDSYSTVWQVTAFSDAEHLQNWRRHSDATGSCTSSETDLVEQCRKHLSHFHLPPGRLW